MQVVVAEAFQFENDLAPGGAAPEAVDQDDRRQVAHRVAPLWVRVAGMRHRPASIRGRDGRAIGRRGRSSKRTTPCSGRRRDIGTAVCCKSGPDRSGCRDGHGGVIGRSGSRLFGAPESEKILLLAIPGSGRVDFLPNPSLSTRSWKSSEIGVMPLRPADPAQPGDGRLPQPVSVSPQLGSGKPLDVDPAAADPADGRAGRLRGGAGGGAEAR